MNSARIMVFTFAALRMVSYANWAAYLQERWQSGRMYLTRNQAWVQIHRGFESHPLRQTTSVHS